MRYRSHALPTTLTRALTAALVAAAAVVLPAPAASAATDISAACPAGGVPVSGAAAGSHTSSVDCLAWYGISVYPASSFEAGRPATRAELAAFLAGVVDASDRAGAGSTQHTFTDVRGHTHEQAIARLSDLGVIHGFDASTFRPNEPVTRAQMAALLMRAGTEVHGLTLPALSSTLPFRDVGHSNVHYENISRLARSGITSGVTATSYDPGGQVTRGQAASFIVRLFSLVVADGGADPKTPEPSPWRDLGTSSDPLYNATTNLGDRARAALTSFHYAGQPLCTEYMREMAVNATIGELGIAYGGLSKLALETRDGYSACVLSAPSGNDGAPTMVAYRRPASTWKPSAGCFTPDSVGSGRYYNLDGVSFCTTSSGMRLEMLIGQHVYVATSAGASFSLYPITGLPDGFIFHFDLIADTARVLEGRSTKVLS